MDILETFNYGHWSVEFAVPSWQGTECLFGPYKNNAKNNLQDEKTTGWWFQSFFIFHNIWDNPSH